MSKILVTHKEVIEELLKACYYYADGWHYRKKGKDIWLETGERALKAIHKVGAVCNRPTCKRCKKKK